MRALVVYESMFGNTEKIARAIGSGLSESLEVEEVAVASAPPVIPADVTLLVVGGPTHAFSMSRRSTREDAVKQGAPAAPGVGVRDWLSALTSEAHELRVVTFDTRVSGVRHLPGSAAKAAARAARKQGLAHVERGQSFYVTDTTGPLMHAEAERATAWGRDLARTEPAGQRGHATWT